MLLNSFQIILLIAPMALVLLSLAFLPLIAPNFWYKSDMKILGGIAIISTLMTFAFIDSAGSVMKNSLIEDYVPFVIMLFALYVLSNGIYIKIEATPNTLNNLIFLGICSIFSSIIGTTGASMLFLKPFIEMNGQRKHKAHLMIFFIFMVSNIGGLLTPLGDPPLLLGYLHGVEFFWCLKNLGGIWLFYITLCLLILAVIDHFFIKKERSPIQSIPFTVHWRGCINIFLISATVIILFCDINTCLKNCILLSFSIVPLRKSLSGKTLKRTVALLFIAFSFLLGEKLLGINFINIDIILISVIAIMLTKKYNSYHAHGTIDLEPFKEVAATFFVIFTVMAPVTFILHQYSDDIHGYVAALGQDGNNSASIFFWICGLASSFLDNAPSYLLFFNMAGGDSNELMYVYTDILKAVSCSSVIMGAMTYIGNAPNMMVRAIAAKHGIKMPSFIGYIGWSVIILLPLSVIVSLLLLGT